MHLQALAPEIASQLPRAPVLATTLLQHLAVSREATAETKELLLLDALRRALVLAPRTGSCAVVVNVHTNWGEDLEEDGEERFYSRYGFLDLSEERMSRAWLPMQTVAKLFEQD